MENKNIKNQKSFYETFKDWLTPSKPKVEISANDAYLQARYNKVETKEEMYNKFLDNTNRYIMESSQYGKYYCTVEMEKELIDDYMDKFLSYFRKKGYSIIDIRQIIPNLDKGYIFICWANFKNFESVKNEDKTVASK